MTFPNFFSKNAQVAPKSCMIYQLDSNHKSVQTSEPHDNAGNPGADKNSQLLQAGKNKTKAALDEEVTTSKGEINGGVRATLCGIGIGFGLSFLAGPWGPPIYLCVFLVCFSIPLIAMFAFPGK